MFRVCVVRKNVVFTEQSPVLRQAADALGLKSNVWVEDWMVTSGRRNLQPSAAIPNATKCTLYKPLEMFNTDQLYTRAERQVIEVDKDTPQHTSFVSRKPYGKAMAFDMENIAIKNSYESKWWVPAGKTFGNNAEFIPRSGRDAAHKFFITASMNLFPLEKLEGSDVEVLLKTPISGLTRRFFSEQYANMADLRKFVEDNGFSSYLYFTEKQLAMKSIAIKAGAQPLQLSSGSSSSYGAYNICQLAGSDEILASIGRYGNPESPVYLFSGVEVKSQAVIAAQEKYPLKYWVSVRDVQENQWALVSDNEQPSSTSSAEFLSNFYNVEQLEDPKEGFVHAGLLEMAAN